MKYLLGIKNSPQFSLTLIKVQISDFGFAIYVMNAVGACTELLDFASLMRPFRKTHLHQVDKWACSMKCICTSCEDNISLKKGDGEYA